MRILLVSLSKLASWQTCQHQPCMWLQDRIDVSTNLRSYDLKLTKMSMCILLDSLSKLASWQTCQHQPCMWLQVALASVPTWDHDLKLAMMQCAFYWSPYQNMSCQHQPCTWLQDRIDVSTNLRSYDLKLAMMSMRILLVSLFASQTWCMWLQDRIDVSTNLVWFKVDKDHDFTVNIKTCHDKHVSTNHAWDCKIALTSVPT